MSIGEVLARLRPDFPDTTISKLRFLETEGLVEPRRTAAGYRKYSWSDIARLRYVLTAQRDRYLPLRVIREQLAALDGAAVAEPDGERPGRDTLPGTVAGGAAEGDGAGRIRPTLVAVDSAVSRSVGGASPGPMRPPGPPAGRIGGELLSRAELVAETGLDEPTLTALEQYGLLSECPGGGYDADARDIAAAVATLSRYGLEARHLRGYRAAADREIGLFAQLVTPLARQPGPAARARAAEAVRELAASTERLHAALVRAGLRETLGR